MLSERPATTPDEVRDRVLGYLNFSSGSSDPKLLEGLNYLWELALAEAAETPVWRHVLDELRNRLESLHGTAAFQDVQQAESCLDLVEQALPAYREFHRDLLFHQDENVIFNAFFVGRVCEAILQQGPDWQETDRILQEALSKLNDYVGYRPIAILETKPQEVHSHERLRPVPLYIAGSGVAAGRYKAVVELGLQLIQQADDELLRRACFHPDLMDELAVDPRAYDFDHPANKRPNHHFGMWDPHCLDNQSRYRRFVVQQVTLDALMRRLDDDTDLSDDERLFEAAAVLAGTVLMASGISGSGPDTHDSNTSLATLLPQIAAYRDDFYQQLLQQASPEHTRRLEEEAVERRQPFGAARQHLNAQLARRRASQLEHSQLAKLFARMGYQQAAMEQAHVVPAASSRMLCQIDCRLTAASHAVNEGRLRDAQQLVRETTDLLQRGIECGAIADPWAILGNDAQFSLFPNAENSVHDHRFDELIAQVEELFVVLSRTWSCAAAGDDQELAGQIQSQFSDLSRWWRKYAPHEVSNVEAVDPQDAFQAAEHVARALNLWHKGGASVGDIGFWAPHADMFDSPSAYALVIDALFEQSDFVAIMGLLVHWLSESERVPLEQGESSFYALAERWLLAVGHSDLDGADSEAKGITTEQWGIVRKFFDYVEANAEHFWQVVDFRLGGGRTASSGNAVPDAVLEPDDDGLFQAAYEGVVFSDSADDGTEGNVFEEGSANDDELSLETERINLHLAFHSTVARLWRIAALSSVRLVGEQAAIAAAEEDRRQAIERWKQQADRNRRELLRLMEQIEAFHIPAPFGDYDSMVEYDRKRVTKESLLDNIIGTCVETADTCRILGAACLAVSGELAPQDSLTEEDQEESLVVCTLAGILRENVDALDDLVASLVETLADQRLLYVPLARGGSPGEIVAVRVRQRCMQNLLRCLPRVGLIVAACRLLEVARDMERNNPVGPGAVTEFDELFKTGFKSIVECVVESSTDWHVEETSESSPVVARLEKLTELLLTSWLAHSRTLRLSVLERVSDQKGWERLVKFIDRYGEDLFTQRFLSIGNIRAILHQGVERWLLSLKEEGGMDSDLRLIEELESEVSMSEATSSLSVILEAVVENYGEYRDYNSTTTQSDRGELLYSLLDFLRLRAQYDRVCWNLKPVVMVHEILVRKRRKRAAQTWRRALRERIGKEADRFDKKLGELQKKYAMQMPSIADRIAERFVRPMIIDRVCALVEPAVQEAYREGPRPTFRILQYEVEFLTKHPSGVGFDVPAWLVALEDEVLRVRLRMVHGGDRDQLAEVIGLRRLTEDELEDQLDELA